MNNFTERFLHGAILGILAVLTLVAFNRPGFGEDVPAPNDSQQITLEQFVYHLRGVCQTQQNFGVPVTGPNGDYHIEFYACKLVDIQRFPKAGEKYMEPKIEVKRYAI